MFTWIRSWLPKKQAQEELDSARVQAVEGHRQARAPPNSSLSLYLSISETRLDPMED
jgi:hypothetical protein